MPGDLLAIGGAFIILVGTLAIRLVIRAAKTAGEVHAATVEALTQRIAALETGLKNCEAEISKLRGSLP